MNEARDRIVRERRIAQQREDAWVAVATALLSGKPTRRTNEHKGLQAVIALLIGPNIPAGYMVATGHAYDWCRWWYGVWMVIGLLIVVGKAANR